jgi:hypothetical protein
MSMRMLKDLMMRMMMKSLLSLTLVARLIVQNLVLFPNLQIPPK